MSILHNCASSVLTLLFFKGYGDADLHLTLLCPLIAKLNFVWDEKKKWCVSVWGRFIRALYYYIKHINNLYFFKWERTCILQNNLNFNWFFIWAYFLATLLITNLVCYHGLQILPHWRNILKEVLLLQFKK